MGTIAASVLIARARRLLQDQSNVAQRWTDPALLELLNEGQLATVSLRPDSNAIFAPFTLVAGVRQTLPVDGAMFLRLTCNLDIANNPLQVITPTTVGELDGADSSWRTPVVGATRVLQAARDPGSLFTFYVYPAITGKVEIQYAKIPVTLAVVGDPISLNDYFQTALVHFVVYKALEQDTENEAIMALAAMHQKKFYSLLSVKPE